MNRSKKMLLALLFGCLVGVFPAMGAAHFTPEPASSGMTWHLEAEGATSMGPAWSSITFGGIDCVYRAPATQDGSGWFQWEGLNLVAGNYAIYVSWTRPGSGWTYPNKVWAGPDANNLREVVSYWDAVGLVSYAWEWDIVAASVPLLATDTVIKITAQGLTGELEIDDFMLTVPNPHLEPSPYYLGQGWHLEAEGATSRGPAWNPLTFGGISIVYRAPATQDGSGWFQWEGLNLLAGDYDMYVSWTRPGSGWTYPNKVWAGPDAGNLREVVSYWEAVGFNSYVLEWDKFATAVPLLATDTVIRITAQGLTSELEIDDFLITTNPNPVGPGDPCDLPPLPEPEWGRGNDIIMERGLQIQAQVFPYPTNSWDLARWAQSNFTTACIQHQYDPNIMGAPPGVPWSHYDGFDALQAAYGNAFPYYSNLISQQYGDEQNLNQESERINAASYLANWRELYPGVLGFTNQGGTVPTPANMAAYLALAKPDMLLQDVYPFSAGTAYLTDFYRRLELYRSYAMLGNPDVNDSIRSIPHGMYLEAYTGGGPYFQTESEIRLNQFACWVFGCKFASAYVYQTPYSDYVDYALLFTGIGDTSPTVQFNQMAETNRQSLNLGEALVRLASTRTFMIANQYALPDNVPAWNPSDPCTDPYITGITATNLSGYNGGNPGDVLIGYFKPLHESFDGPGYSGQDYFMIVNGLCADYALAADTQQRIDVTFDFGASGITQLQRVSRNTGLVEAVPLISLGGSLYKLELTLPGGTGDLFKFNTGAPFINGPYACGDIGTEYLPADLSGPDGEPDCRVDMFDFAALAEQWHRDMSTKQYTLLPVERGSTGSLGGDLGFQINAYIYSHHTNETWVYWEKYDIPVYPGERIIDDRGVVVDVNLTTSDAGILLTPGIYLCRSAYDGWVVGPPRTITSGWPVAATSIMNRTVTNDGTGMGLRQSNLTPWFRTQSYGGPESQGMPLTIRYEASGGGRGGQLGAAGGGCTLTITTEPDIGTNRSADVSGPAGVPDDTVNLFDLDVFVSFWLDSSFP